jgi:hypothetical protein
VQVPRHGEQPGTESRVGPQPRRVRHEAQPGFLEQVFGDVPAARQPHQECEETDIERGVHLVECLGVTLTETLDEGQLTVALHVHNSHNARAPPP